MKPSYSLFAILLLLIQIKPAYAQTLPYQISFSEETHLMKTGGQPPKDLYDINVIRNINILFYDADWYEQMEDNYGTELAIPAILIYNGDTLVSDVGVYFRGHSSYYSNDSIKKSVGITLDYTDSLQNIDGYTTLNLNCSYKDPTFMHEAIYENAIQEYIPALSVNYVHLYLNNADFGLYTNVEQLDKTFLKEWFLTNDGTLWRAERTDGASDADPGGANGTGFSTLNYLGSDTSVYKNYYTLKETKKINPWDDLIEVCDPLNNAPDDQLEDTINKYLDLDRTLWYMACEILFTDEDSYVQKGGMDYFLYWEPETDRMVPLEYDGNSVLDSIRYKWKIFYKETDTNYALSNNLFAVPSIRQRFLAHFRTLFNEIYTEENLNAIIDSYFELIDPYVENDTVKLYTYEDFLNAIDQMKQTIVNRRNFISGDHEFDNDQLLIDDVKWTSNGHDWGIINSIQPVTVSAFISGSPGIQKITLYYSPELFGPFIKSPMYDDGMHGDQLAGDLIFGGSIPAYTVGTQLRYYVEATADDEVNTKSYDPPGAEHNVYYYIVATDFVAIENPAPDNFSIYPNPAKDEFMIFPNNQDAVLIEIYTITGAKVFSSEITGSKQIDVSGWLPGIYIIKTDTFIQRLTIQ